MRNCILILLAFLITDTAFARPGGNYDMMKLKNRKQERLVEDPRYRPHPSGGSVLGKDTAYANKAAAGKMWRITSDCASACTMGFGRFSKEKICIANGVKLGFHESRKSERGTSRMWNAYPPDVQAMINARGGLKPEWTWILAAEFHKIGYQVCK